jgi:hypothetical protein
VSTPKIHQRARCAFACLAVLACAAAAFPPPSPAAVLLYGVSGDGATPASTLYVVDPSSGASSPLGPLGNGDDGEGIAFRPDDGMLYHSSGRSDGLEFLETVNPDSLEVGPNLAPGGVYGPTPATEITAIGWYPPLGVFLASDLDWNLYHVTPAGQFTLVGNSGVQMRGFAVVGTRVYGIDPFSPQLFEIDPGDGGVLATLPLSVDGFATTGNGLATHPDDGAVFAILKDPGDPSGGRLLATLDVATGQATSIGNTGLKLAGITFRSHAPLFAISGDGASPASTLFRLDLGSAATTPVVSLGNGNDGEGIAFRPEDQYLYHSSGGSDGSEYLERVHPSGLFVGANLAPGDTYGPDPAGEITAIAWYPPLGVFLASDLAFDFYHVTPQGDFHIVGNSGLRMRGLAVVGSRVYAVSPFSHSLYEVDPADGAILATLPLTVDGQGTTGNGLATSPDTGVVFAIVKNPFAPGEGRLLARLDVATGQATGIGDTDLKLAGITFGVELPPAVSTPALSPLALWLLTAALLAPGCWLLRRRR